MNRFNSQNVLPRIEIKVHFRNGHHGQRLLKRGENERQPAGKREDLPRLTRLLALAHRWNRLIEDGIVTNYAEIARLMGLSRARITQITDLLYLAPGLQEEILLPTSGERHELDLPERAMRQITRIPDWNDQRTLWRGLCSPLIRRKEESDW